MHQSLFQALNKELSSDSDRSCVIVATAVLDDQLGNLLKAHLAPNPSSRDSLFDDANAPLGTFSVRIDLAYRLGIISSRLAGDLHKIRKLRNEFAHSFAPKSFDDGAVQDRIEDIIRSIGFIQRHPSVMLPPYDSQKGKFITTVIFLAMTLSDKLKKTTSIAPSRSEDELIYDLRLKISEPQIAT